jgi:hypothetical protein
VGQRRVGQRRVGQRRVGQRRVGQRRVGQRRVGQRRVGQRRVGQGRVGQRRVGQGRVGQGRVGRGAEPRLHGLGVRKCGETCGRRRGLFRVLLHLSQGAAELFRVCARNTRVNAEAPPRAVRKCGKTPPRSGEPFRAYARLAEVRPPKPAGPKRSKRVRPNYPYLPANGPGKPAGKPTLPGYTTPEVRLRRWSEVGNGWLQRKQR